MSADWEARSGAFYSPAYTTSVPSNKRNYYKIQGYVYPDLDPDTYSNDTIRSVVLYTLLQVGAADAEVFIPPHSGGQVRHCMKGNRLYRFASYTESGVRKWVFDDIDIFSGDSITRPILETPPNTFYGGTASSATVLNLSLIHI